VRARRTPPVGDPLIQQTLLGEAVDSGPAAIFVMGDDRKYVAVNETACRLLGYERAELLALDPAELAPEADVEAHMTSLKRDGDVSGTIALRAKNGEVVEFTYRAAESTVARMLFWIVVAFPR
jgi:PAS domain S-box-containing protein